LTQVRAFGREKNLPRSIRTRLVSHYENIYPGAPRHLLTRALHPHVKRRAWCADGKIVDEVEVIGDLPKELQREVVGSLYGPMLDRVSFLSNFGDDDLVVELGLLLKPQAALAGAAIALQGDDAESM
jgi:hypothetical protein